MIDDTILHNLYSKHFLLASIHDVSLPADNLFDNYIFPISFGLLEDETKDKMVLFNDENKIQKNLMNIQKKK